LASITALLLPRIELCRAVAKGRLAFWQNVVKRGILVFDFRARRADMPKVIYIEFNGTEHQVEVPLGLSVMRGAVDNNVPGIDADCGGECACATCHVYVDPAWLGPTGEPPPGSQEAVMLSFAAVAQPNSRLACQIKMTQALDGLLVRMPEGQH
jgi:ferredoxin, 2Fe-2S